MTMTGAATLVQAVGKGKGMKGEQIDDVCIDWLKENYGEELATKYRHYSLVIPMWNTSELNEALETLMQVLCIAFGPDESFGTVDYYEVRRKLKLSDDRTSIPEVFLRAFAKANE
jgi:hypothetical protein